ncbi:Zinc finger protein [Plakobranchus ocellatus]|uniref:Zinc finger protein n=1 Tax=Plakobranchus ocellatus TaxID=259542 RepID=A0AAV4AMD3_9GAST|nr:Zinc finger protein [Plakobranchus ocellatus]
MVDAATRWPEAVPLKGIGTREVAEALFGIFTRLGLAKQRYTPRTPPVPHDGILHQACLGFVDEECMGEDDPDAETKNFPQMLQPTISKVRHSRGKLKTY